MARDPQPSSLPPSGPPRLVLPVPAAPVDAAWMDEPPPRHLRDYLRVLAVHRRLAATCFLLTLAITVLVALFLPRRYAASTRLQVARQSPIQLRLADNVRRLDEGENGRTATEIFVATQVAALQSRDLAERVVQSRALATEPTFAAPARAQTAPFPAVATLVDALRPRGWVRSSDGRAPTAPATGVPVDALLLERYMSYLAVHDVRGTDLIEVSFTTPSPALSAFLAAAHTQAFLEANEEARHGTDDVAKDFLARQLEEAKAQVERAEHVLGVFAAEHPSVAVNQEQQLNGSRIAELSTLLTKAEGTRTTLESRYDFLTSKDSDPLSYFLDQPGVQKLRLTLLDLDAQEAALRQRLGPNHPQMVELQLLAREVEAQLRAEVTKNVAAVRARYDAARLREERLRRKVGQQEELGVELRVLGGQYDMRKGELDGARQLHASLLKQRTDTAVNAELTASNVRIVERPEVPQHPSRPRIPLTLTLGTCAGLVLAIAAAFAAEYLDQSVRSSDEVEDLLHLPTLATIPNFALARAATPVRVLPATLPAGGNAKGSAPRRDELLVLHEPWSRVAEAFRSMRTAVLFAAGAAPPKVVLLTSARAAEGKTVTSLNLASTLAEAGARVVLVDADLRHPRCHAALGVENTRGLSGVLTGDLELDAALTRLESPPLVFLPAGPPPPNPAELVTSPRLRELVTILRARFDFVIIDTPPVLPVTDAAVLAREADGVVLVVKGHDTPRELVRRARDRLVLAGASFLGVIVNNVGPGWGDPYFYETYRGYAPEMRDERQG